MTWVVRTTALAGVVSLGLAAPVLASGQDPTPAAERRAVAGRIAAADSETSSPAKAGPSAGAVERRSAPAEVAWNPAADRASMADEQRRSGGQTRGAVRRPPSGGAGQAGGREVDRGDRAVPRTSAPRPTERVYITPRYDRYYRSYDPWAYGAFGLGYFYYSPWAWSPGYYGAPAHPGYYGQAYGYHGYDVGSVRLKVRPRDAEVYVDGYFAGMVDDFDGVFQSLKLDSGAYRIEVRKAGFETLQFDVRVQPGRTITFEGELRIP